jgi:C4-dicarboxylate-specific signal transduction histidine kinase
MSDTKKNKTTSTSDISFLRTRIKELEEVEVQYKHAVTEREKLLHEMRERVKELSCMYSISQSVVAQKTLNEILNDVVEFVPNSWQYPVITRCRIYLDSKEYISESFEKTIWKQSSDIHVDGKKRGFIEVYYLEKCPDSDEGVFLKEERNLIDSIARTLSGIVKSKEGEEEKEKLEAQLLHADRLATIGQLASGIAHELNEPLGNILGFAQLAQKVEGLPSQAISDLEKIDAAAIHAREIIRKLMAFARQTTPHREMVNINFLIKETIFFYETLCSKEGIELALDLEPNLPVILADAGQMKQVLTNLIINSMQAMPSGGKLDIKTSTFDQTVSIVIRDTGLGMSKEVMSKIFLPFFTTKDVNEGTGLGLAVVYGIVNSHKGKIKVDSTLGKGTTFELVFLTRTK